MTLPSDLIDRLCIFLNYHELSCITGIQCTVCANFKHLKILDKDIDNSLIKNYCKSDKKFVDQILLKKISNTAQRIHVLGNHWPLVNSLKHRKFSFFVKHQPERNYNKDSVCITDTDSQVNKEKNKLIITQGYSKDYNLSSVDFLLIEKKHIDDSFDIPFDQQIIPDKGFLIIDLNNDEKFYSEG
jgi:hypothetical protein